MSTGNVVTTGSSTQTPTNYDFVRYVKSVSGNIGSVSDLGSTASGSITPGTKFTTGIQDFSTPTVSELVGATISASKNQWFVSQSGRFNIYAMANAKANSGAFSVHSIGIQLVLQNTSPLATNWTQMGSDNGDHATVSVNWTGTLTAGQGIDLRVVTEIGSLLKRAEIVITQIPTTYY